jgi:hypothetical protein
MKKFFILLAPVWIFTIVIFITVFGYHETLNPNLDLSKPINKIKFYDYLDKIVTDSFKTKSNLFKESSHFYYKNSKEIQDTLKQKVVVNFQLYKPLKNGSNTEVVFVMITFLKKEIDIVKWSYSEHFVQASEDLFETGETNSFYIKQK